MKTRSEEIKNRIEEIEIILSNYVEEMNKLEVELEEEKIKERWDLEGTLLINDKLVVGERTNYFSELNKKAFWLSNNYDWRIEEDNTNVKCLVPYKK